KGISSIYAAARHTPMVQSQAFGVNPHAMLPAPCKVKDARGFPPGHDTDPLAAAARHGFPGRQDFLPFGNSTNRPMRGPSLSTAYLVPLSSGRRASRQTTIPWGHHKMTPTREP